MPRPSRLLLAKEDILASFRAAPQKVYSKSDLTSVLTENRHTWHLPKHVTIRDFIAFLIKNGDLRARKLRSETYGQEINRYTWGSVSDLELAASIRAQGYFCHATALSLHGLVKLPPKTIYLNVEQSTKPALSGTLSQQGLDRAFASHQRQSKLIYKYKSMSVVMISGKSTNRLGVEEMPGPALEMISATNLERTLIDIVVRPAYAGGPSSILEAYRAARGRLSTDRLLRILSDLDHMYPYHQAIGFLMQRVGYPETDYRRLQALGLDYDFYLGHGLKEPAYSKDWRLYYPANLPALRIAEI